MEVKKCPNCGKMNLDKANVCAECQCEIHDIAAGTFKAPETQPTVEKQKITNHNRIVAIVLAGIVLFPISWLAIYIWNFIDLAFNDADYYGGWTITLYSLLISIVVIVVGLLIERFKSDKQKLIDIQFDQDSTSICPKCGGHDIKVYRKGYDYGQAFWQRKYGGRYTAGMDSNTACCRCLNCGNDWETNYDYRMI